MLSLSSAAAGIVCVVSAVHAWCWSDIVLVLAPKLVYVVDMVRVLLKVLVWMVPG